MLTDAQCKTAKLGEKSYKLGDAGGLYLLVSRRIVRPAWISSRPISSGSGHGAGQRRKSIGAMVARRWSGMARRIFVAMAGV